MTSLVFDLFLPAPPSVTLTNSVPPVSFPNPSSAVSCSSPLHGPMTEKKVSYCV
jgi:hypothetical protein